MQNRLIRLAALFLGAILVANQIEAQQLDTAGKVMLQPGDAVHIVVWDRPDWSGEFEVKGDGTLRHPQYNQLKVTGIPVTEIPALVQSFVAQFQRSPVDVEPLLKVTVDGAVRTPNAYTLPPEATLIDALAKAGGATDAGRLDQVVLIRDGQDRKVDLTLQGRSTTPPIVIHSGDRIVVERRSTTLRDIATPIASLAAVVLSVIGIVRR